MLTSLKMAVFVYFSCLPSCKSLKRKGTEKWKGNSWRHRMTLLLVMKEGRHTLTWLSCFNLVQCLAQFLVWKWNTHLSFLPYTGCSSTHCTVEGEKRKLYLLNHCVGLFCPINILCTYKQKLLPKQRTGPLVFIHFSSLLLSSSYFQPLERNKGVWNTWQ